MTLQAQLVALRSEKALAIETLNQDKSSLEFSLNELRLQHEELQLQATADAASARLLREKLEQVGRRRLMQPAHGCCGTSWNR